MRAQIALVVAVMIGTAAARAGAQDSQAFDKIFLGSTGCTLSTGSGAPSGGNNCDTYIDYTNQILYTKIGGVWTKVTVGAGTIGKVPKFGATANALTDSVMTELSGNIGIGTTSPNYLMSLSKASVPGFQLLDSTTGTGSASGFTFALSSGDAFVNQRENKSLFFYDNGAEAFGITPAQALQTSTYASQTTGWQLSRAGALDVRYLYTDELRAKLFTADMESVLAGSQRVTKSFSTISQTFTCPNAGAQAGAGLWVFDSPTYGDAAVFESNDQVIIHNMTRTVFGPFTTTDCVGVVTSYSDGTGGNAGTQSWAFTRNSGGDAGSMVGGTPVAATNLVQDMGVSGNGYVETSAVDGAAGVNAPYTQIVTWATAPVAANLTTRCRLGNLKGITSVAEYGLLCGNFSGNAYVRFSDQNAEITGIPFILKDGSTVTMKLDPSVPSFAMGSTLPSAFGTGTGIWMGKDTTYKFRVGDPAGNKLTYDAAGLTLVSDTITVNPGISIAIPPTGFSSSYGYRWVSSFSGTNWVGTFGSESSSTQREVSLKNTTSASGKSIFTFIEAANNSVSVDLTLTAIGSAGTITAHGPFGIGSSTTHWLELTVADDAVKPTTNTWTIASDAATKEHIVPYDVGALDLIRQVQIREYDYTGEFGQPKAHGVGPVANEIQALFPRSVSSVMLSRTPGAPKEPILLFNAHELWMTNVQAVIELDREVEQLKADVAALQRKAGGQQ